MILSAVVLLGLLAVPAKADLASSKLFGIEVKIGTQTISGYGIWSSEWLWETGAESFTDEALLNEFRKRPSIQIAQQLAKISHPIKTLVVTKPILDVPKTAFISIRRLPQPHDSYSFQDLRFFPPEIATLLDTPPIAKCEEIPEECRKTMCYGQRYWLSYNPSVQLSDLKPLCEGPLAGKILENDSLRRSQVFRYEISGD